MMVNDKIALNSYTTDIREMDLVNIGDMIIGSSEGDQFNITEDKEYKLLSFDGDCIQVENDLGIKEWYSVDYFHLNRKSFK